MNCLYTTSQPSIFPTSWFLRGNSSTHFLFLCVLGVSAVSAYHKFRTNASSFVHTCQPGTIDLPYLPDINGCYILRFMFSVGRTFRFACFVSVGHASPLVIIMSGEDAWPTLKPCPTCFEFICHCVLFFLSLRPLRLCGELYFDISFKILCPFSARLSFASSRMRVNAFTLSTSTCWPERWYMVWRFTSELAAWIARTTALGCHFEYAQHGY